MSLSLLYAFASVTDSRAALLVLVALHSSSGSISADLVLKVASLLLGAVGTTFGLIGFLRTTAHRDHQRGYRG